MLLYPRAGGAISCTKCSFKKSDS
ncbi:MAG: hypothetical protein FJX83_01965 [Bacteroidetes bacterium]|nr:hypothetical protein [Bacteroidota bacterium]